MENATYVAITRQTGLLAEMQAIANNIANSSTTGFRKEGVIFSEYVKDLERDEPSLSMARASGRMIDLSQGALASTGGIFDFAIEGPGFFMLATPTGNQLTRAGAFALGPDGSLLSADGFQLLDVGGAPIQIDPAQGPIGVAQDGTVDSGGVPVAQIGLFLPAQPGELARAAGTRFRIAGDPLPADGAKILQGFLENSNVNPVSEITRMIEVQRAYELGQAFLDREDARIRGVIQAMAR